MSRRGMHPLLMGLDKPDRKVEDKPLGKPAFPMVCPRLCGLACPTPSTGDAFLFCSLLRPPMQISRCGLSALPREIDFSSI